MFVVSDFTLLLLLWQVYCHHEGSGCTWQGKLCDVDSHLSSFCPRVLVECPNNCGERVPRECIQSHAGSSCTRRPVSCAYCNDEGPLDFITDEHHKTCPKVPLPCPNHCPVGKILREDLTGHLQECPLQTVECRFRSFGCNETIARKDLDSHMTTRQTNHLLLAVEMISELSRKLDSVKGDSAGLKGELQRSRREMESLRNMVEALESRQQGAMGGGGGGEGVMSVSLDSGSRQTHRLLMEKHLEASVQICQQDPFLPVFLKMDDFSYYSTHREPWYSTPFYSEPLGYKLCLCVYASGICSGQFTHLSAYVHLMAGEFDDNQEWPLELMLTIELQNQLADKDHWGTDCEFRAGSSSSQRVVRGRARRGAGTATLIQLDKLGHNAAFSNCQYLRNNQLFFAVY